MKTKLVRCQDFEILTAEILEANGFVWRYGEDSCNSKYYRNKELDFSVEQTGLYGSFYNYKGKEIKTVRQLRELYSAIFYKSLILYKP